MTTDSFVSEQTAEALQELQAAVKLFREAKPRTPKGVTTEWKQRWSNSVATILADASYRLLEPFLRDVKSLPPSVVADGAAIAWTSMSNDRQTAYLRWVAGLDPDRAASHAVVLIPRLLNSSPATSIDLLGNVSVSSQEAKNRFSSLLLIGQSELEQLVAADVAEYKVRKVLANLLQISDSPKVTGEQRWRIIRLSLVTLTGKLKKEGDLLRLIDASMIALTPKLKEEMKTVLAETDPELLGRFFPLQVPPNSPITPPTAAEPSTNSPESVDTTAHSRLDGAPRTHEIRHPMIANVSIVEPPSVLAQLTDWITKLQSMHAYISGLEEQHAKLEQELRRSKAAEEAASIAEQTNSDALSSAEAKSSALEQRLKQALEDRQTAHEQAEASVARVLKLTEQETLLQKRLTEQQESSSRERTELGQRIQTNAERRLEEYRNALASSLVRLCSGLPNRRSEMSAELGDVVLTRLYEVIDFLESKGIRTLTGAGRAQ